MRKFVVFIFNLRNHGFQKVNIVFTNGEVVELDSVYKKVKSELNTELFMLMSWSPVDEFSI